MLGASLRVQEQCFTEMNVVLRSLPENQVPLGPLPGILTLLRAKQREQYLNYCEGRLAAEGLPGFLDQEYSGAFSANDNSDKVLTWLLVGEATSHQVLNEKAEKIQKNFLHLNQQQDAPRDQLDKLEKQYESSAAALRFYNSIPIAQGKTVAKVVMGRLEAAERFL